MGRGWVLAGALLVSASCGRSPGGSTSPGEPMVATTAPGVASSVSARSGMPGTAGVVGPQEGSAVSVDSVVDTSRYPWHADGTTGALVAEAHLEDRIAPPDGFERVRVERGSFGEWLRRLPLAAVETPVRAYNGRVILAGNDPHVASVVTLDVGSSDLQQCADAVMRLHGEWKWSRGERDMAYRAASGTLLPYARWARGERVVARGAAIHWVARGRATAATHEAFRKFMDAVFAWSNTVALARQGQPVRFEQARPGDFLILPGNPGHAVLLLDMAVAGDGRKVALLGQSYMPAQSFHVLRPASDRVWFALEEPRGGVQTPFWPVPFPWSSLRRLD